MPNDLPFYYRALQFVRRVRNRLVADRGPGKRPLWVLLGIAAGAFSAVALGAGTAAYISFARGLPSIDWARHYRPPIVSTVWSGDEQLIGEFYNERRVVVPYDRIPKRLKQAVIASEDAGFFEHSGVSYQGLLRALYQTYIRHKRIVGGSTLSQQTAKAILASAEAVKAAHERKGVAGIRRKIREFILTPRLED